MKTHFDSKVTKADANGTITYVDKSGAHHELAAKYTVGADGAFSQIRTSMGRHMRMDVSLQYITHGYKELTIPAINVNIRLR